MGKGFLIGNIDNAELQCVLQRLSVVVCGLLFQEQALCCLNYCIVENELQEQCKQNI